MNRPSKQLLAAAAIGVACLAGCNDDGARTTPSTPSTSTDGDGVDAAGEPNATQWLYVMDAAGGAAADGTLTLRDVDEHTISFSDRPAREVRRIPTADLVASWAELGFDADPPNASVTFDRNGVEHVHTVTLSPPTVDGDDLTFGFVPLDGPPLAAGEPTDVLPSDFGPASLFIDASSAAAVTGTMTMVAITQAEYEDAVAAAKRRAASACVEQDGSTLCTFIGIDDGITWNVVAEVPASDADAVSEMTVDLGPNQPVTVASTSPTALDSQWISLTWDAPGIPQQGIGVELDATLQTSGSPITAECFVRPASLYYYCLLSRSTP